MKISHVQQKLDGFGVTSRQQHSFDAKWDYTWKIIFTEKCFLYRQKGYTLLHMSTEKTL